MIISSWWGRDDYTDSVLPKLLDTARRYRLEAAFLLEPMRTAARGSCWSIFDTCTQLTAIIRPSFAAARAAAGARTAG